MFTIVIPYYNGSQYITKLLATIPEGLPVIIVDDKSDQPLSLVRPNAKVVQMPRRGYFTGAVNYGIELSPKTDILILNQDTYFTDSTWLNFITENRQQYGLIGERAGTHPAWPNRYIHGTFMYIRRDVIDKVGLMDAANYPHWGSTADYQVRACRKGFKVLPSEVIPGFVHTRQGHFGTATQQALQNVQRGKLLRTPPAISVIITCYNYGRYLQDAVNSLIGGNTSLGYTDGQTFQGFEIVIVDDGSTDDSAKIGESLADPWKGIHFASQPNQGSAAAMNTGIVKSHARSGHFIAPLDGDDMMKPQRLEHMMKTYQANPHSVIYDNMVYFANGQEGVVTDWQTGKSIRNFDNGSYDFERMLLKNNVHKGLLYPKQAWEEAGGYPISMKVGREDWAFNIALGIKGWCGVNTRYYEYLYRRELQNRTLKNTTRKHHRMFLGQLREIFPDIYEGHRPMACCGRPSAMAGSNGRVAAMTSKQNLPGQDGFARLEYIGANSGDETWYGPVTKQQYYLGGVTRQGYVDIRDAKGNSGKNDGMLNLRENGRKLFKEIVDLPEPEAPKALPDWETVQDSVVDVTEFTGQTVSKLKSSIPNLSVPELEALLEVETRVTAKSAIEAELDARLA